MSAIVSIAGMALPFGLGSALSIPLYNHFIDPSVQFTHFMLFTGVAYSITAFPVLCRILTELKLLDTTVGVIVLSAGVGNDVVGWTLLALSVALVNAGSGLTALWILLTCLAFTIFLIFVVKRLMLWLARSTGSTDNGPTMFYMTVVMILLWSCAFFTDIVGVNAIFGLLFLFNCSLESSHHVVRRRVPGRYHRTQGRRSRHCFDRETRRYGLHRIPPFSMCSLLSLWFFIHAYVWGSTLRSRV
jgi:hypothetical protein